MCILFMCNQLCVPALKRKKQQSELKLFQVTIDMVAIRQVILGT